MTIQAQVIKIDLLDIRIDEYTGINDTTIMLDIDVGMKNAPDAGSEIFQTDVVTVEEFNSKLKNHTDIISGRGCYIVEKIDRETLQRVADHIAEKMNSTQGETWHEVSRELSWYAIGEFERYDQINNRYY